MFGPGRASGLEVEKTTAVAKGRRGGAADPAALLTIDLDGQFRGTILQRQPDQPSGGSAIR